MLQPKIKWQAEQPDARLNATAGTRPVEHAQADFAPVEGIACDTSAAGDDAAQQASLQAKAIFDRALATLQRGAGEEALALFLRAAEIAEAAREWHLSAIACHRVGDYLLTPGPLGDVERALRMYRRSAAAYEQCGLFSEAGELTYTILLIRQRRGRELGLGVLTRLEGFLYWLTAGFGFRPLRIIGSAGILVVLCGLLYWAIEGAIETQTGRAAGVWDALYFSGITFATVGYGDFVPAPHARLLALTEGFLGAFTMGAFVVVLAHRLARP